MDEQFLEMRNISKSFFGIAANDRVNLSVNRGEIHALLGENGAGKTTLMNVLTGLYKPDEGSILLGGKRIILTSPRDAIRNGIGMVHQNFRLVDSLTVTENVVLGLKSVRGLLNLARLHEEIGRFADRFGLKVDPKAEIWQISVGERQRVEILKMLYRQVNLLIMDEPTAVLTPQEVQPLFDSLRSMAGEGRTVIIITHKLNEVMEIADRITVLRAGKAVATVLKKETGKQELARLMVGREIHEVTNPRETGARQSVLELERISALNDRGLAALSDLTLTVYGGEVLGVAGVAGNGQKELVEVISGLRGARAGSMVINGRNLTNGKPREIIDAGVAVVPEDRVGMGLALNLSLLENLIVKTFRDPSSSRNGFFNLMQLRRNMERVVRDFDIRSAGIFSPVKLMSGGNQQKLLFARETLKDPRLLVAAYPCRGLDLVATRAVQQIMLDQKERGAGVLLISEDLDELLGLSDRIAVIYEGRIMGVVDPGEVSIEKIGLMMCGECNA